MNEQDALALIDALAQEAYGLYEDNSDDAYGAWSWLTEKARLVREGVEGLPGTEPVVNPCRIGPDFMCDAEGCACRPASRIGANS